MLVAVQQSADQRKEIMLTQQVPTVDGAALGRSMETAVKT
jgi:hypothetical protein